MTNSVNNNSIFDNKSSSNSSSFESIKEYNGRVIQEFQDYKKNPNLDSCDKTFILIATAKVYEKQAWKNLETLEYLNKHIPPFQTPKNFRDSLSKMDKINTASITVLSNLKDEQGTKGNQPSTYQFISGYDKSSECLLVNQYQLHTKTNEVSRKAIVALLFDIMAPRVYNLPSFAIGNEPEFGDHSFQETFGKYIDYRFTLTNELDKNDVLANGLGVKMTNCKNISELEHSLDIVSPSKESVVLVRCDVGPNAQLGIRGQGENLTWHESTVLRKISQNLWAFPTNIDLSKVEAKFVRIPTHGDITWEKISNDQNRKFTSAKIQTCIPEIDGCNTISEGKEEVDPKKHFIFKFNANGCENLVVRGEIKNWSESFPLKHLGNGMWFLELPLSTDKNEIHFKILKGDAWETGENRVLILDAQQEIISLKDPEF